MIFLQNLLDYDLFLSVLIYSLLVCLKNLNSKNGAPVGAVYKEIKCPLFPTVSVHSPNEE